MNESFITKAIFFIVYCISILIWFVIGLILWLPLLVRATAAFTWMIIHATVTNQNPQHIKQHLEAAIGFWFMGFRLAKNTLYSSHPLIPPSFQFHLSKLLGEFLWTTVFWFIYLYIFYPLVIENIGLLLSEIQAKIFYSFAHSESPKTIGIFILVILILLLCILLGFKLGSDSVKQKITKTNENNS